MSAADDFLACATPADPLTPADAWHIVVLAAKDKGSHLGRALTDAELGEMFRIVAREMGVL